MRWLRSFVIEFGYCFEWGVYVEVWLFCLCFVVDLVYCDLKDIIIYNLVVIGWCCFVV